MNEVSDKRYYVNSYLKRAPCNPNHANAVKPTGTIAYELPYGSKQVLPPVPPTPLGMIAASSLSFRRRVSATMDS